MLTSSKIINIKDTNFTICSFKVFSGLEKIIQTYWLAEL